MEFELIFNGAPAEFGVAVKFIVGTATIGGAHEPIGERSSYFPISALQPDANPVTARLFLIDSVRGGHKVDIQAYRLPNGKTRLVGQTDDEPEALRKWGKVLDELKRQGWIDYSQLDQGAQQTDTLKQSNEIEWVVRGNLP